MLSGTGSAVFGIAGSRHKAEEIAARIATFGSVVIAEPEERTPTFGAPNAAFG